MVGDSEEERRKVGTRGQKDGYECDREVAAVGGGLCVLQGITDGPRN